MASPPPYLFLDAMHPQNHGTMTTTCAERTYPPPDRYLLYHLLRCVTLPYAVASCSLLSCDPPSLFFSSRIASVLYLCCCLRIPRMDRSSSLRAVDIAFAVRVRTRGAARAARVGRNDVVGCTYECSCIVMSRWLLFTHTFCSPVRDTV